MEFLIVTVSLDVKFHRVKVWKGGLFLRVYSSGRVDAGVKTLLPGR